MNLPGRLTRTGKIGWGLIPILSFGLALPMAGETPDADGAKDPKLLNRMPGYFIYSASDNEFNRYEFKTGPEKTTGIEGRYCYRGYAIDGDKPGTSPLAIIRNYENAARSAGGVVVFKPSGGEAVLKIGKGGTETWIAISTNPDGKNYEVYVVERKAMEQAIVIKAEDLAQNIKTSGRVALYGIHFDTGKAEIKSESESAIQEIARLLKADSTLKLHVVGHTDNVGGFESNLKLSRDRAETVVRELVSKHGIAAARLNAFGDGPVAPVASNVSEEGRAQNRRVELVQQ